jgi:methyl-accepting chemotaxis protein
MTLIEILTVVVLVLVSALIIALIVYIGKITRSVQDLQKDISKLSDRVDPLVSSLTELSSKVTELSAQAQTQLETTKKIITSVKDRVNTILGLEEKIRTGIEGPIMGVFNQIKAITNGVSTFLSHLKK